MQNQMLLFALTIVGIPAFLITLLIALLCRLFRNIVIGPYLRCKYGKNVKFLNSGDAAFAMDNQKNRLHVRTCYIIKGKANIAAYQQRILTKWVKNTTPELDMYKLSNRLCCELGYFFWLPKKDFKIEQHCYLHDIVPKNENELNRYYEEFLNSSIPNDLSPWSMTCINLDKNFPGLEPGPHHIFLAYGHHAICDAFSFWSVNKKYLFDQPNDPPVLNTNNHSKMSTMTKLKRVANILAFGPGALIANFISPPDNSILHGQPLSGTKLFGFSKPVSLDRIKKVKNITKTTVNDVITSCISGALRSLFLKEGVPPTSSRYAIPVAMHSLNKPPKVENKTTLIIFHDAADRVTPMERLVATRENMNKLKNSELPIMYLFFSIVVVNSIPRCIVSKIADVFGVTMSCSNSVATTKPVYIFGQELVRITCITPTAAKVGLGIVAITYNDQVVIGVSSDVAVIKNHKILDRLIEDITQELEDLEKNLNIIT